jgi:hypothetical protein
MLSQLRMRLRSRHADRAPAHEAAVPHPLDAILSTLQQAQEGAIWDACDTLQAKEGLPCASCQQYQQTSSSSSTKQQQQQQTHKPKNDFGLCQHSCLLDTLGSRQCTYFCPRRLLEVASTWHHCNCNGSGAPMNHRSPTADSILLVLSASHIMIAIRSVAINTGPLLMILQHSLTVLCLKIQLNAEPSIVSQQVAELRQCETARPCK